MAYLWIYFPTANSERPMFSTKKEVIDHVKTLGAGEHVLEDLAPEVAKLVARAVTEYSQQVGKLPSGLFPIITYKVGSIVHVRTLEHEWQDFAPREYVNRQDILDEIGGLAEAKFFEADAKLIAYIRQVVTERRKGELSVKVVDGGCIVQPRVKSPVSKLELFEKLAAYSEPFEIPAEGVLLARAYISEYNRKNGVKFGTRKVEDRQFVMDKRNP